MVVDNPSSDSVAHCIERLQPSIVILSASGHIELETLFIVEARNRGLTSVSFIDIWSNYRGRFQRKCELIYPDFILAIDECCANEMLEDGIPEKHIKVIGQPYLEDIISHAPGLGSNILIASQPIKMNRGKTLGYNEVDFWELCIKATEKYARNNVYATRHPDEVETNSRDSCSPNIIWAMGQGSVDVANSHTVLGMFSMQMIIAYLWDRKVASVQPNLSMGDPSPLSRWGLVPRFERAEEIAEFISDTGASICSNEFKSNLIGSRKRFEELCINGIS